MRLFDSAQSYTNSSRSSFGFDYDQIARDGSLRLGDLLVEEVEPVTPARLRTKAGRLSLKARLDGRPVKVFEAHGERHAEFIEEVTNRSELEEYFPSTLFVHGRYVVAEWVSGKTILYPKLALLTSYSRSIGRFLEKSAELLGALHGTRVSGPSPPGFDYLSDYLWPRFGRACLHQDVTRLRARRALATLERAAGADRWLSHPDLTPSNVVFPPTGGMTVIDNELLGATPFGFFDEINLLNSLSEQILRRHRERIRSLMQQTISLLERGYEEELFDLWAIRQLGTYHVEGDIEAIKDFWALDPQKRKARLPVWPLVRQLTS